MADKVKKTKKKITPEKAPAAFPANPTRLYGACVRKMQLPATEAAVLVKEYGFRLVSRNGDLCILIADAKANRAYEAGR